jgi:dihydrofolate reductase
MQVIVSEFVTLDGVMEAPGGEVGHPHSGWVFDFMGPEQEQFKLQETLDAEALLIGRVTYESFAGAWPQRSGAFADKMNAMPKFVATTTRRELEWENATVLDGDVPGAVSALRARDGGPLLVAGSRTLLHTLMAHDLVDEYRLMVFPVLLGSGDRWYPDSPDKVPLELVGQEGFSSGVTVLTYRPRR